MKTTSRVFIGATATGLFLVAQAASAAMDTAAVFVHSSLAVGQSGSSGDPRREVLDRLSRARQAMDEGQWEIADSLVSQAEKMNVEFGRFHLGDTPKKARRDLERRRPGQTPGAAAASQKDAGKSSTQAGGDRRPPMQDPFQAAGRGAASPTAGNLPPPPEVNAPNGRLPPTTRPVTAETVAGSFDRELEDRYATRRATADRPAASGGAVDRGDPSSIFDRDEGPRRTPFGHDPVTSPDAMDNVTLRTKAPDAAAGRDAGDAKARSDSLLVSARRALAVGDVQRATLALEQAKSLSVQRNFHEDSPAKVEAAVRKYTDLIQRTANKDSEAYRRRYVELLMDQSEGLLLWRDFDEAERLANDAKKLPVTFGPFDAKPDDLLKRIATVKRQAPGGGQNPSSGQQGSRLRDDITVGLNTPNAFGGGLDIPFRQDNSSTSSVPNATAPDRQRVLELVQQARAALAAGDVRRADQLAREAQSLRVPDSAFQRGDDRPELVLLEVQKQLGRGVVPAAGTMPGARGAAGAPGQPAGQHALYNPATDRTRNVPAAGQEPLAVPPPRDGSQPTEIPPPGAPPAVMPPAPGEESLIDKSAAGQQVLARKVAAELGRQQSEAKRLQETDPKRALEILKQARASVEKAGLDEATRGQFQRSLDRRIAEVQRYIDSNRPRIELNERNEAVKQEIDREQAAKVEVQEKLARMVDEYQQADGRASLRRGRSPGQTSAKNSLPTSASFSSLCCSPSSCARSPTTST